MKLRNLCLALTLLPVLSAPAAVAAPSNDDLAQAQGISSVPFSVQTSTAGATTEIGEPSGYAADCPSKGATVWFAFAPRSDTPVLADVSGSNFDAALSIYIREASGGLRQVSCTDQGADFLARAGLTYYFQAGGDRGPLLSGVDPLTLGATPTGTLRFEVAVTSHAVFEIPPRNDDQAQALSIPALPFRNFVEAGAASLERDEPRCTDAHGIRRMVSVDGSGPDDTTVWYRYAADHDGALLASSTRPTRGSNQWLVTYEETPAGLREVSCGWPIDDAQHDSGQEAQALIQVATGHTYLFQVWSEGYYVDYLSGFSLKDEPTTDLSVANLSVDPTGDHRTMAFDLSADAYNSWTTWTATECPSGDPSGCATVASGQEFFHAYGRNRPTHIEVHWDTTGCVGDVTVQVHVGNDFNLDPNPSNDVVSAPTSVVIPGSGFGAGRCPPVPAS